MSIKQIRVCDECKNNEALATSKCIMCEKDLCDDCGVILEEEYDDSEFNIALTLSSLRVIYHIKKGKILVCDKCESWILKELIESNNVLNKSLLKKIQFEIIPKIKNLIMLRELERKK